MVMSDLKTEMKTLETETEEGNLFYVTKILLI